MIRRQTKLERKWKRRLEGERLHELTKKMIRVDTSLGIHTVKATLLHTRDHHRMGFLRFDGRESVHEELPATLDNLMIFDSYGEFPDGSECMECSKFTIRVRDPNSDGLNTPWCRGVGVGNYKMTLNRGELLRVSVKMKMHLMADSSSISHVGDASVDHMNLWVFGVMQPSLIDYEVDWLNARRV